MYLGAIMAAESSGYAAFHAVECTMDPLPPPLLREWRQLAPVAAEPNSFQEIGWFGAAWDHLRHEDVRLIEVRCPDGSLAGAIALQVKSTLGRLPIRHVTNWRYEHGYLGTPLVRRGCEAGFWGAVLDYLDDAPWAAGMLHIRALTEGGPIHAGLSAAAAERGRAAPVVHRIRRAMLKSDLSPERYYEQAVRKKKRKELARLANRLRELGEIRFRTLEAGDEGLAEWCEAFLALERSGWKGRENCALACKPRNLGFLDQAFAAAHAEGRLQIRSLELDGRPIAMLINLLAPPGAFMFKTAYDEDYARFSPGVLLQIENLDLLVKQDVDWVDSCAAENHPMIDALWTERREIARVTVRLAGVRRGLAYAGCRGAEKGWAAAKQLIWRGR